MAKAAGYAHRDRVMRAYFKGRDWDENPEFLLKRRLVLAGDPLLNDFPFLIDDEWEVVAGASNAGKGDLLFADGSGRFAVVEVKWMNATGGGRSARTARNQKRRGVRSQAWSYAVQVLQGFQDAREVRAMVLTDDWRDPGLRDLGPVSVGVAAPAGSEDAGAPEQGDE